MKKIKNEIV